MTSYAFRIVNVFAIEGDQFSGNPLCVFENATGIDDATMQRLALQFNLSETTFLFPSDAATARVRIFSTSFEMPFAGHPTLGTAHVLRELAQTGDDLTLEMKAGIIPVTAQANRWTLKANAPTYRDVAATQAQLAAMLGITPADVIPGACWVDTGSDQLVIPLRSAEAVARCAPVADLLMQYGRVGADRYLAYVFADDAKTASVTARFFFPKGTAIVEDPATGSACANLGGHYLRQGVPLPLARTVRQGAATGRPSELHLRVSASNEIFVSGLVCPLGRGTIEI